MVRSLLYLYSLLLIVHIILSYLPQFKHQPWAIWIKRAADFTCKPIKSLLPPDLPFDFSPVIVILLINLLKFLW